MHWETSISIFLGYWRMNAFNDTERNLWLELIAPDCTPRNRNLVRFCNPSSNLSSCSFLMGHYADVPFIVIFFPLVLRAC